MARHAGYGVHPLRRRRGGAAAPRHQRVGTRSQLCPKPHREPKNRGHVQRPEHRAGAESQNKLPEREVWFNHEADGDYTLQSGDDCILYAALQGPYADAETFAADCMAVMQRAADDGLGFTCYHFNADEDIDDGISYYLDCVASYPAGLTAAQVAQRVQASYHYDNNSFSSEADRDDYIRRQLQNEISDEYADRHDGAYPDEKYLNEETERRFAERTGMATPESAQA